MADNNRPKQKKALYRRSLIRNHHRLVFIVVMSLIVLLFLANLITRSKDYSQTENRSLTQKPGFLAGGLKDGTYSKDFDAYYSDQFVFRDSFIKLRFIGSALLHIKENAGVLNGKEQYQFEIPAVPDKKLAKKTIKRINDYAELKSGIETRMMIVPSSAAILKDKLPANAAVPDQVKDINDYYNQLSDNVAAIDVSKTLKKADQDNLYYKTDHHWTSEGAYTVFKSVAGKLGIDKPVRYKKYTVSTSFKGTLTSKSGDFIGKDVIEIFVPKSNKISYYVNYPNAQEKRASIFKPEMLETKDQYTVFFGGNHPLVEINTTANSGRNLLLLKDSYANSFVQFLIPYYDSIIMVDPRYYYDNVNMVISNYRINEILYLYSADTLFTDTSLADALEAAIDAAAEDQDQSEEAQGEETQKE